MIYKDDKSTIFSIAPVAINEFKPGVYPGHFELPVCQDFRRPERLVVGSSDHLMVIPGKKQPIRITTPSYEIAKSVVDDFMDGQLNINPEAKPGVMWMQGEVTVSEFLVKFEKTIYHQLIAMQKRWLLLQVARTNNDWAKYKNSRVVTDVARFAVQALGLPIPEWMQNESIGLTFNKCPACSTMNDPDNAICTNCHCVLNEEKHKKLVFAK